MSDFESALQVWQQTRMLSVLRLIAGLLFLEHGSTKLFGFPPDPHFAHLSTLLLVQGVVELLGGALIALGLFTRIAAFIASGDMAVAYFISHFPRSYFPELNGGDAAVLYCFVFLYLASPAAGPGAWTRLRSGLGKFDHDSGARSGTARGSS